MPSPSPRPNTAPLLVTPNELLCVFVAVGLAMSEGTTGEPPVAVSSARVDSAAASLVSDTGDGVVDAADVGPAVVVCASDILPASRSTNLPRSEEFTFPYHRCPGAISSDEIREQRLWFGFRAAAQP